MCLRQITETDELVHNDCTVCATLMGCGFGTCHAYKGDGSTEQGLFRSPDGTQVDAVEMKALREKVRTRTGDVAGGTSIETVLKGVAATWPALDWLECEHLPIATIVTRWKAGQFGAIQGNPIGVANVNSKLRRWTRNDDYGHSIGAGLLDAAGNLLILDPMAPNTYTGDRVPLAEVQQFMRPLRRLDGTYHTLLFGRGALMHSVVDPASFRRYAAPRGLVIAKGAHKLAYRLDLERGQTTLAADVALASELRASVIAEAQLRQYPNGSVKPNGLYYLTGWANIPAFKGVWLTDAGGALGPVPPEITQADLVAAGSKAVAAFKARAQAWFPGAFQQLQ
jgi:hypothetical protein